jgi:hypothetical protein
MLCSTQRAQHHLRQRTTRLSFSQMQTLPHFPLRTLSVPRLPDPDPVFRRTRLLTSTGGHGLVQLCVHAHLSKVSSQMRDSLQNSQVTITRATRRVEGGARLSATMQQVMNRIVIGLCEVGATSTAMLITNPRADVVVWAREGEEVGKWGRERNGKYECRWLGTMGLWVMVMVTRVLGKMSWTRLILSTPL